MRRGDGYVMCSEGLREPFFNRAGALTCRAVARTAAWAERTLSRRNMNTTILVYEDCVASLGLLDSGYRRVDTMVVLFSAGPVGGPEDGQHVSASTVPNDWTSAYLRSFYGDDRLMDVVTPIVVSLLHSRDVTLLESRMAGEVAGVLAIFRTNGIAGVYCVGTAPEHRREGVATRLLTKAKMIADSEGRALVLQTLKSDGVLGFYHDRGFEQMHAKAVLEKRLK